MAQGNDQYLTEVTIRLWMRDNDPEANKLLDDYEFSPEELRLAMTLCQDYWNETPPFLSPMDYTQSPFRFHLLQGAVSQLLFMAAHRFRRNSLPYSAGGVSVQDQEKEKAYEAAGDRLWQQYRDWVARVKLALNVGQGWGYG